MTDEQFSKFMAVQVAQVGMLQGIQACIQAIAMKQGEAGGTHWGKVSEAIAQGAAIKIQTK